MFLFFLIKNLDIPSISSHLALTLLESLSHYGAFDATTSIWLPYALGGSLVLAPSGVLHLFSNLNQLWL